MDHYENKLRQAAVEVTGDESIIDVAMMMPSGTIKAQSIGMGLGSVLGSAGGNATDSSWGSLVGVGGALIGGFVGQEMASQQAQLPADICVAVTPTKVYLLGDDKNPATFNLSPLAEIERRNLGVSVKNHWVYHEIALEDATTGAVIGLEIRKLNLYDGKALIEMLMLGGDNRGTESVNGLPEPA